MKRREKLSIDAQLYLSVVAYVHFLMKEIPSKINSQYSMHYPFFANANGHTKFSFSISILYIYDVFNPIFFHVLFQNKIDSLFSYHSYVVNVVTFARTLY